MKLIPGATFENVTFEFIGDDGELESLLPLLRVRLFLNRGKVWDSPVLDLERVERWKFVLDVGRVNGERESATAEVYCSDPVARTVRGVEVRAALTQSGSYKRPL